jgi:thioredoxin-like negative regulator of GroEL
VASASPYNVLLFTQPTCGPCKVLLTSLSGWKITVVDVWKMPDLALHHKIKSTPTTVVVNRATGRVEFSSTETNPHKLFELISKYLTPKE